MGIIDPPRSASHRHPAPNRIVMRPYRERAAPTRSDEQRGSALERAGLVDRDAVHERGYHPRLADLAGRPVE